MSPNLCPHCHAAGIIATVNGPTCTHHQHGSDDAWFPPGWSDRPALGMGVAMEIKRLTYIEKLNTLTVATQEFDFA